ncbi:MAG: HAD-IIA family hydrolase [Candidatus Firestonebacteria bacterium]
MLFLIDLDGVLFRGNKVIKNAPKTIKSILKAGHKVIYLTNNATQSRLQYVYKLRKMNFPCTINNIMTSAYATCLYLKENNAKKIIVIGENGLKQELKNIGTPALPLTYKGKVEYIIVGLDRAFNYNKLCRAQELILKGAKFIATNRDNTWPAENRIYPGGGSIVSAIEAATSIKPIVIGKPQTYVFKKTLEITKTSPKDTIIVGDRLDTDILLGKKIGAKTVLVLTGVTTLLQAKTSPKKMHPDYIFKDISGLLKILSPVIPAPYRSTG